MGKTGRPGTAPGWKMSLSRKVGSGQSFSVGPADFTEEGTQARRHEVATQDPGLLARLVITVAVLYGRARLQIDHVAVSAAAGHQGIVVALFDDAALLEDDDPIGVRYRAQTMRYD